MSYTIHVHDNNENITEFRINNTTSLSTVLNAYSQRIGKPGLFLNTQNEPYNDLDYYKTVRSLNISKLNFLKF